MVANALPLDLVLLLFCPLLQPVTSFGPPPCPVFSVRPLYSVHLKRKTVKEPEDGEGERAVPFLLEPIALLEPSPGGPLLSGANGELPWLTCQGRGRGLRGGARAGGRPAFLCLFRDRELPVSTA